MKLTFLFTTLFLVVNISYSQIVEYKLKSGNELKESSLNPYQIIIKDFSPSEKLPQLYSKKTNSDDNSPFPVFPGFPVEVDGRSTRGGINCNMDSDPDLEIVYALDQKLYAWNMNGSNVSGWPVSSPNYYIGTPAYGDINGDKIGEVVIAVFDYPNFTQYIHAYRKNGTQVSGFPVLVGKGYTRNSVVLGDFEMDGSMEIITILDQAVGKIFIIKGDGSFYPNWPVSMNEVSGSSPAVGDITRDNIPDIIATSGSGVYVFDISGNILPGFPFVLPPNEIIANSDPVLADLDNNNEREITFGTYDFFSHIGNVYVLNRDGAVLPGWPQLTSGTVVPVLPCDINENNVMDIIAGDIGGNVHGWDKDGNKLPGFPIQGLGSVNIQAAAGDIDNDGHIEIIFDCNYTINGVGNLFAFNGDGTPVNGWPLDLPGATFNSFPSLTDLNHDGNLDIVASIRNYCTQGGDYSDVYAFNTGIHFDPLKIINPVWQFNSRHNGVYGDYDTGVVYSSLEIPLNFGLKQNYPNPFNPNTNINYELPHSSYVTLKIYDMLGKEISTLVNGNQNAGRYTVEFKAEGNLPSGAYFYKITAGAFSMEKKMILLK